MVLMQIRHSNAMNLLNFEIDTVYLLSRSMNYDITSQKPLLTYF